LCLVLPPSPLAFNSSQITEEMVLPDVAFAFV
jgi:hypothetical protein